MLNTLNKFRKRQPTWSIRVDARPASGHSLLIVVAPGLKPLAFKIPTGSSDVMEKAMDSFLSGLEQQWRQLQKVEVDTP